MTIIDSLGIFAFLGFVGIGVYSFAVMFFIFRRFGTDLMFGMKASSSEILGCIPKWVKLLGAASAIVFLGALLLLGIVRP